METASWPVSALPIAPLAAAWTSHGSRDVERRHGVADELVQRGGEGGAVHRVGVDRAVERHAVGEPHRAALPPLTAEDLAMTVVQGHAGRVSREAGVQRASLDSRGLDVGDVDLAGRVRQTLVSPAPLHADGDGRGGAHHVAPGDLAARQAHGDVGLAGGRPPAEIGGESAASRHFQRVAGARQPGGDVTGIGLACLQLGVERRRGDVAEAVERRLQPHVAELRRMAGERDARAGAGRHEASGDSLDLQLVAGAVVADRHAAVVQGDARAGGVERRGGAMLAATAQRSAPEAQLAVG